MSRWKEYLDFLDGSPHSVRLLTSSLAPERPITRPEEARVGELAYGLWPFQQRILDRIGGDTLILGLPTGLGKTYIAGAYLKEESHTRPIRVLFVTPTVPLGVQQTLFARRMLGVEDACFISGNIPPEKRTELRVWNTGFAVATPQTFFNDNLSHLSTDLDDAKRSRNPVGFLSRLFEETGFSFPYSVVVADECQRYIGETDGYSLLLSAKASRTRILALSATPQLHAPKRLAELRRVFDQIEVFSIEDPEISGHMPDRVLSLVRVHTPETLLKVYTELGKVVRMYQHRVRKAYGAGHARKWCKEHPLCVLLLALKVMRFRLVEDGASSVVKYRTWKTRELRRPLEELGGKSVYDLYRQALRERFNHKLFAAMGILRREVYEKAIVFVESVEAAKQLGTMLQKTYGVEDVAVLVGRGNMSMEQQASALLHFKERAKILVCTSVGEEGLDIPTADIEVWVDPPSNPKKWIQRFGRILRQPGDKERAVTHALVSMRTHERNKLLGVKRRTEEVYSFTQSLVTRQYKPLPRGQESLTRFTQRQ
ncbi:MAG: helicase-related protein [Candidatus Bathyarchaeia archaeon]